MNRHLLVVQTNAVEGREDEFNEWYDNEHIDAVLNTPGWVAAQRFRLSTHQHMDHPYPFKYLAIYELEGDLLAGLSALEDAIPAFVVSDAMDSTRASYIYEAIGDRIVRKPESE